MRSKLYGHVIGSFNDHQEWQDREDLADREALMSFVTFGPFPEKQKTLNERFQAMYRREKEELERLRREAHLPPWHPQSPAAFSGLLAAHHASAATPQTATQQSEPRPPCYGPASV